MWALLRLPRFRGATHADDHDNRYAAAEHSNLLRCVSPVGHKMDLQSSAAKVLMLRAERTWRGRYLRVTRVTPLTFYQNGWCRLATRGRGRLRFMVALAAPLPGTTYAGTRWSTLAYVEKVRTQFLSLRHRKPLTNCY